MSRRGLVYESPRALTTNLLIMLISAAGGLAAFPPTRYVLLSDQLVVGSKKEAVWHGKPK